MTDLEMTKLCAEAMGFDKTYSFYGEKWFERAVKRSWHPLENDDQAMALVKKFGLRIEPIEVVFGVSPFEWQVGETRNPDLNRAIVECVAKMQKEKQ